jgi:flagellar biosynthesis chaperone FliJ
MPYASRLDRLVTLRYDEEQEARRILANAIRRVEAVLGTLDGLQQRLRQGDAVVPTAALWDAREAAGDRLRTLAQKTAAELAKARQQEEEARRAHLEAHRRAEVMKRVAESRREEIKQEATRFEARREDEERILRFVHNRSEPA